MIVKQHERIKILLRKTVFRPKEGIEIGRFSVMHLFQQRCPKIGLSWSAFPTLVTTAPLLANKMPVPHQNKDINLLS